MNITMCRAIVIIGFCLSGAMSTAQTSEVVIADVQNPERAFGYTIGDTLDQTIYLQSGNNPVSLMNLPLEQREGRWVVRSKVALNTDGTELNMLYQIINAPPDVRVINLPELSLFTSENVEITVPSWAFTIAPLIPATDEASSEVPLMQADFIPAAPSSEAGRLKLHRLAAALVTTLLFWLLWWLWRNWREAHSLPFALAHRKVRHAKPDKQLEQDNESWLALHRAFNHSAGKSIAAGSVPELLAIVQWLQPLEEDINAFFRLSSARFFSPVSQQQTFNLKDFSKRLYIAEKRNNDRQNKRLHSNGPVP